MAKTIRFVADVAFAAVADVEARVAAVCNVPGRLSAFGRRWWTDHYVSCMTEYCSVQRNGGGDGENASDGAAGSDEYDYCYTVVFGTAVVVNCRDANIVRRSLAPMTTSSTQRLCFRCAAEWTRLLMRPK